MFLLFIQITRFIFEVFEVIDGDEIEDRRDVVVVGDGVSFRIGQVVASFDVRDYYVDEIIYYYFL